MILQSLCEYYETLLRKGTAAQPGWSPITVKFALVLGPEGELRDVLPLQSESESTARKTVKPPQLIVPEQAKRTAGVSPNFLCDSPAYFLGIDGKENAKRALECFVASKTLHQQLLSGLENARARAVCAFFDRWEPEGAGENPALKPYLKEILKGGSLVFRVGGRFVHRDDEIAALWDEKYLETDQNTVMGRCLVTGEEAPIARTHPSIKGVRGGQSNGVSLVSFNADAFCSYGKEQSFNAPVSRRAAFAYTTALNYLTSDSEYVQHMGDATVVYWSETGEQGYRDLFGSATEGKEIFVRRPDTDNGLEEKISFSEGALKRAMSELGRGRPYDLDGVVLKPDSRFYVLGLSPNVARASVRFFYRDNFGHFMKNVWEHYDRLQIERPAYVEKELISVGRLLFETVNKNASKKEAQPNLVQGVMGAILNGTPYPQALYNAILLRVRAEQEVPYEKAAVIKAFLLKNSKNKAIKEAVHTVNLNDDTNYLPYVLGRLFSLLENIQQAALPSVSTTIKDRYFIAAASTPLSVFPKLLQLQNSHMKVLEREKPGFAVELKKQLGDLMERIGETFPKIMTQEEQGAFYIGYYHQTQKRFAGKNEKKAEEEKQNG